MTYTAMGYRLPGFISKPFVGDHHRPGSRYGRSQLAGMAGARNRFPPCEPAHFSSPDSQQNWLQNRRHGRSTDRVLLEIGPGAIEHINHWRGRPNRWAELAAPSLAWRAPSAITVNADLSGLCAKLSAERIVLFRTGLIISQRTLEERETLNIHCADFAEFGGLASICRALGAYRFEQHVTLDRATNLLDCGEILDTKPFQMDPALGCTKNETMTYEARLKPLERTHA